MGWRDLMLERITDDDSGGGFTDDFFTRSYQRRGKYPGVSDPISDLGPLGDRDLFEPPPDFLGRGRNQEKPISSIVEPWRPSSNRRSGMVDDDEGPAMTNYLRHIETAPDLNTGDYNPSVWRRMLAGLAGGAVGGAQGGLAGIKAASEINNEPYKRAVQNYQIKGEALESAARLEDVRRKTRQAYEKQITDAEDKDADREVKWANSRISEIRANATIQRNKIDQEIRTATNQITRDRLEAQKKKWDDDAQAEIDQLEVNKMNAQSNRMRAGASVTSANAAVSNAASNALRANAYGSSVAQTAATGARNAATGERRATAYEQYMGRLGRPKPVPQTQVSAARTMSESETRNAHMVDTPNEPAWFDAQGYVKPEFAEQFEREVQERIARKIRGYGDIEIEAGPDNDWEPIP